MTQTWWLSFSDPDRPPRERFLGVVIVDVTEAEAGDIAASVTARRAQHGLPLQEPSVDYMAAAIRKAHRVRANPGGEVAAWRIDDQPNFAALDPKMPRDRLLSKADLVARDL